jgi:hypothetical protein
MNFGERKRTTTNLNLLKMLSAFAFAQIPVIESPTPAFAEVKVSHTDKTQTYNAVLNDYMSEFSSHDTQRQVAAFINAIGKLKEKDFLDLRMKFFQETVSKGKVPVFINVIYPNFFTLEENLDKINFDLRLILLSQKVYEMINRDFTKGNKKVELYGLSEVELEWASVMIARNIMLLPQTTDNPEQSIVVAMFKKIMELRKVFESVELFGKETLLISATEFDETGVSNFSPQKMKDSIKKLSRFEESENDFNLKKQGLELKSKLSERIRKLPPGSTIIFNTHGKKDKNDIFLALYKEINEHTTIKVDDIISWFKVRYADHPELTIADSKNPFKFIFSECDARFVTLFLKKWVEAFGNSVSVPITFSESEENSKSLIKSDDPNKSYFFSHYIFQNEAVSNSKNITKPTLKSFMERMLPAYQHGGNYRTKPMIFVPLLGKYMQIAETGNDSIFKA